jgi:hypothetical protein
MYYLALGLNDFDAGKSFDFFGPKWHSFRSLPFQGPKKSRFSGPTPSNGYQNVFTRIKIITSRAISTTGTLIVNLALYVLTDGSCRL